MQYQDYGDKGFKEFKYPEEMVDMGALTPTLLSALQHRERSSSLKKGKGA